MQELGLIGVIVLLMTLLTYFGGSTRTPRPRFRNRAGYLLVRNKFLNVDRL